MENKKNYKKEFQIIINEKLILTMKRRSFFNVYLDYRCKINIKMFAEILKFTPDDIKKYFKITDKFIYIRYNLGHFVIHASKKNVCNIDDRVIIL